MYLHITHVLYNNERDFVFLTFSGSIKMEHWTKTGQIP